MTKDLATVRAPIVSRRNFIREIELQSCMLVVETGPDAGKRFGPLGEHTTIGRELYSDIALSDESVSREHCELTWTPDGIRLRDLNSTNGIVCDDKLFHDVTLGVNARFRIGSTTLRLELQDGTHTLQSRSLDSTCSLVGGSVPMQRLFNAMQRVAPREISVLLLGETGTGKTTIARAMHGISRRTGKRFVSVNCATLQPHLVESTLFGHLKGSFTGADRNVTGFFEQAAGGSVVLDEIGELPFSMQAKLLSVLDNRKVRPIGSEDDRDVDFRLFCATNRNLADEVAAGRFRQDLYHRIAGFEITAPPLRERLSDLGMLSEWLTLKVTNRLRAAGDDYNVCEVSPEALNVLQQYSWPGNVRELEYVIERAVMLAESSTIGRDDILIKAANATEEVSGAPCVLSDPQAAAMQPSLPAVIDPETGRVTQFKVYKDAVVRMHERAYLDQVLPHTAGNVTRAAEVSGLSRTAMKDLMYRHGMGRAARS
jgi:transcriptional regulator with GAF, ATPase, and Fis domain